ncbi:hypothetical protein JAO85_20455 [Comamonas sp. NyZ500]|uniref:hypothetical protein n=1 Tax=Comamonas sp. NyZ500 TaxID=2795732 RepID=UPI00192BEFD4|nr:hypothetical protein [Comamonas sp. NyZ500]MBL5979653.1 hypothetical protein [Comamonas sp. NyZ500]
MNQRPVDLHLSFQGVDLGVSALDQTDKLANHARASCSTGCESLVLICEISAGSGVTGKLGVAGGSAPDVVLQACNAGSVNSAPSLQAGHFFRVVMGVFLLGSAVLNHGLCFFFCSSLRLLSLSSRSF